MADDNDQTPEIDSLHYALLNLPSPFTHAPDVANDFKSFRALLRKWIQYAPAVPGATLHIESAEALFVFTTRTCAETHQMMVTVTRNGTCREWVRGSVPLVRRKMLFFACDSIQRLNQKDQQ